MIFLTNEHIQQVLDMPTCIQAMEDAYHELNEKRAGYRPRIDFYVPQEPHYYRWGTMEGASRNLGVFAIRMKSDMLAWENKDGFMVEDKYCIERGTYCGLIFLTSTRNGEPLAIMNDGYLQHMRVGALQVGGDGQSADGKDDLQFVSQQRLHSWSATLQRKVLAVQAVFLKELLLIGEPQERMDRRRKTAAGNTELLLRAGVGNEADHAQQND